MNIEEKTETILFLYPNAEFSITDEEFLWLDDRPKPSESEIENAFASLIESKAAEAAAKQAARQALLDKLGITADEAKLLLG